MGATGSWRPHRESARPAAARDSVAARPEDDGPRGAGHSWAVEGPRRSVDGPARGEPSREVHPRFRSAFEHAPIGMALVDADGRWIEVNGALSRLTGLSVDELKATTLLAMTHPDDVALETQLHGDLLRGEIPSYEIETRYRHAHGHTVWVLVTVSVVRDDQAQPLYLIWQVQDVSKRKELAERLEYLVDHDFLTGLFNRRRFEQELGNESLRTARYRLSGAVVLTDLDHFKNVNDRLGHKAGDDLLRRVSETLRLRIRQTDVLARVGGDEFAILLPQTSAEQARIVAEDIVETLRQDITIDGARSIHVTASVGVAMVDGDTVAELMPRADRAMYEAKVAGGDRFRLHRPTRAREEHGSRLDEAARIPGDMENRVLPYCQPILDLEENEVRQYELQLRLPGERGDGTWSPPDSSSRAERSRLIGNIDSWAVRKAITTIAQHERMGQRLLLHVKLSGASLDSKLAAIIESSLKEGGIDPASLILEVSDMASIESIEQARAFAERLRVLGCRFVLDDFPSGAGSFYYLKNLPFDYVKIDGDFIRGIAENSADQAVVQAIVDIARGLGKKTIADHVDDEATARLLRQSGVDYALGPHVGQPRPLTAGLGLALG
jgi:diguanylate cyclase (GGDEF)-like protein/PAS domain S-box-containing protein